MRALIAITAVGIAVTGCATEDDPIDPPVGQMVLGGAPSNGDGFVALSDGADVELVPGAQGGFHVWISARVQGAAGELYFERSARRVSDDALILRATPQAVDVPPDAMQDWWETPSASPAFMCPSPIGLRVFDEEIDFTVLLTDDLGDVLAEDHITLIPRCPTGQHEEFCIEICSG